MQNEKSVELLRGIETLGGRIKKLRELKGWSQRELGYKVNLSSAGIHKIESNKTNHTTKLAAFCRVFDVDARNLDTADDTEEKKSSLISLVQKTFPNWKEIFMSELLKS